MFYAVKVGRQTGIYNSWEETEPLISGYKGAEYKKFNNESEAQEFLNKEVRKEKFIDIEELRNEIGNDQAIIVTDGSYDEDIKRYGYGIVLLTSKDSDEFYESGNNPDYIASRNVSGEIFGALEGLEICKSKGYKEVFLFHDYEGLKKWADKEWKDNKPISKFYVNELKKFEDIKINFIKVKAHSGNYYNEKADSLAKYSLQKKGSKTYADGTVYITGITKSELRNTIKNLRNFFDNLKDQLTIEETIEDYREVYSVRNLQSKVKINYYKNNRTLYIQGKQSELFTETINEIILNTPSLDTVHTRLNEVYTKQIREDTVYKKMEEIIPHYEISDIKNIDKIIYNAVYNLELNLIKKEYSDLVLPIFNLMEYILHKILNDKLGVETKRRNGSNNFAYFDKDPNTQKYYCNKDTTLLKGNLSVLLNNVYNFYSSNRHGYVHVSYDDEDISIIEDIEVAKDILTEGFVPNP
ncbi:viroplasmin family protein [Nosocomiicoccus ampullae]|uniref:ribonuclease H1 domain-containing protein n=1 Tax=Nosocomiicoccus ampullae TaxID=489910 RepID=UPI001C5D06A3|nr:viroplasmin family protein [Nosocomiicoccus ampullae]QYA47863.1 type II toxin-antitoxin system RnlA family toxin [Nosocomiicoccus ampullae]